MIVISRSSGGLAGCLTWTKPVKTGSWGLVWSLCLVASDFSFWWQVVPGNRARKLSYYGLLAISDDSCFIFLLDFVLVI